MNILTITHHPPPNEGVDTELVRVTLPDGLDSLAVTRVVLDAIAAIPKPRKVRSDKGQQKQPL